MKKSFGTLPSGEATFLYTRSCGKLSAAVTDYGATLVSLLVPDRDGVLADVVLGYDTAEPGLDKNFSRRERIAARWGEHDCPSYVVMRALTPELTDDQRGPFCLRHDEATKSVIGYDLGERDAWGQCRQRRQRQRLVTQRLAENAAPVAVKRTLRGNQHHMHGSASCKITSPRPAGEAVRRAAGRAA